MPTKIRQSGAKSYWDLLVAEVVNRSRKKRRINNPIANKPVKYKTHQARRHIKYQLGEPVPGVYLTQREADCMMQMLNGKTMNESGNNLRLSPRTVEYYLTRIKRKLKCRKKREMINLISKTEFAKNFKQDPYNQGSEKNV